MQTTGARFRTSWSTLCASLLAFLTLSMGCHGAAGSSSQELSVEPAFATVAAGAPPMTFTASGASTSVTWSLSGEGSLSSTTGPSTSYTAPTSVSATTTVRLTATAGTLSATATITLHSATDYVLPPDRSTTWNPGLNAVGGIPFRTEPCGATLTPSGGDDTQMIQDALDACPADHVLKLGEGTFRIDGTIWMRKPRITLRGEGPKKTKLVKPPAAEGALIMITKDWYDGFNRWTDHAEFATDGEKGERTVLLNSAAGLQVGEMVHVSETYDSTLTAFLNESQQPDEDGSADYLGWGEGHKGPLVDSRPIGQAMEIESISGNQVTFTTPFHIAFRRFHRAHLAKVLGSELKWTGVEDLYVAGGQGGDGGGNIHLFDTSYCWVRNVEAARSGGTSVNLDGTFRCELRDSYIHSAESATPGGGGYGIGLNTYAADNLVENNISWNFNKVMVMRGTGGGNVVGYNYMEDGWGMDYPWAPETGLNASHMTTPHHELFEGNQAFNFDGDGTWGNSIYITAFRNHLTGMRRGLGGLDQYSHSIPDGTIYYRDCQNRRAIGSGEGHWWYSFVGNVLGTEDQTFVVDPREAYRCEQSSWSYEGAEDFGSDTVVPMWHLGVKSDYTQDESVVLSALRDANYDYATRSVRWHGVGGVGQGTTPDPAPAIPDSLYLTGKPPFFGPSDPWPWVDGSNASNPLPGSLPARVRMDADLPTTWH